MAGVQAINNRLVLNFKYRRRRFREFLGLTDTPQNRRDAERIARALEREIAAGEFDYAVRFPDSPNVKRLFPERAAEARGIQTLAKYAERWLDERIELKPGTRADYKYLIANHIAPSALGRIALNAISDSDIRQFIKELTEKRDNGKELSARRVNMVILRLRTMFADAFYAVPPLITANPMTRIKNLGEKTAPVDPFTLAEAQQLLDAVPEGQNKNFLTVLIFAGLRPGEAAALEWNDIDWGRRVIKVHQTAGRFGVQEPKTAGSVRDVSMAQIVDFALRKQRAHSQLRGTFVFPTAHGTRFDWENFRQREWPSILRTARLRYRPLYHCRHTFATLLLQHETVQRVAAQLGHTSVAMVIAHYARWTREPISVAFTNFDEMVSGGKSAVRKIR